MGTSKSRMMKDAAAWLPGPGRTAVCAVSGGLDSMCLLHLLWTWCRERDAYLLAAHFNHQLRPTADRDEAFVRDWCAVREIPFTAGRGDVAAYGKQQGLSVEEAARTLRYDFLRGLLDARPQAALYTAHHMEDNAETVLLNLIRGTGLRGLGGMVHCRDRICRPLLDVSREELASYAAAHGIPHVEDETNADPSAAARNRIRLEVMPLLREINPRAAEHLHEAAGRLSEADAALEGDAAARTAGMEVRQGRVTLPREALMDASAAVRPRMLLRAIDRLGVGRKDFGAAHLEAVLDLMEKGTGRERRLDLPHGVTARFRGDALVLETRPGLLTEAELTPGRPLTWGVYVLTLWECPEGPAEGTPGLSLRPRREAEGGIVTAAPCPPGGRLRLPEAKGSRSVKRLCLDFGIDLTERDGLPAIYVDGTLAAVWHLGTDAGYLPEGRDCRFVEIRRTEGRTL